jgi:hypothetical protein
LASDSCSETNRIYNVGAGAIQRIAIEWDLASTIHI